MNPGDAFPSTPLDTRIKRVMRWPLCQAARALPRKGGIRDILFPCYYALMAEYQRDLWEILRDDPRLRFFITLHRPEIKPGEHDRIRAMLPLPEVSGAWANIRPWDLVILADHGFEELCTPWRFPVLRIPHGISGKSRYGGEYQYGKRAFASNGRFRYTLMFEPSEVTRNRVISGAPWLRERIAVVGSIQMDKVLAAASKREKFRRDLGFSAHEIAVFVMSTWGEHSLLHTMGDAIIEGARPLLGGFRFIMSAHPMDYKAWPYSVRVWGEHLQSLRKEGFQVREPSDDWLPYMAACDLILTDHTSLAVYGIPLGKPCLFIPLAENLLTEGSAIWNLWKISPTLSDPRRLKDALGQTIANYPYERLEQLGREINSWPGQSARRMREEIYRLLGMDVLS